jgi:flagellar export protein FliJ
MSTTHGLKSVQTLADSFEAQTSREVAQRLQDLDAEQHRLRQLQAYLDEYRAPPAPSQSGLHVAAMRSRRRFVERIQAGIQHQERLIEGLQRQLEDSKTRWQAARSQSLALQRYTERLDERAEERQSRKDQAFLDEVGRNQFLRQEGT